MGLVVFLGKSLKHAVIIDCNFRQAVPIQKQEIAVPINDNTAIQDDCIRKNPFDFKLNTVLKDNTEPKVPLTPAQEESFLSFAQGDKVYQKYYDELIILLGTGLRISELCGLTDTDIDFNNRIINVDHQLLKSSKIGYYVEVPKTESGVRQIPILSFRTVFSLKSKGFFLIQSSCMAV